MDFVKKVLNGQPTLACMIMDNSIVYGNKKFNEFFDLDEDSQDMNLSIFEFNKYLKSQNESNQNLNIQDIISKFSQNPNEKHRTLINKNGKEYIFDIYVNISYINESETYIVTMLDITEFEKMKKEDEQQVKLASLGQIAMGIAHEINTPLTYIKGNIELMEFDIESMIKNREEKEYLFNTTKIIKDGVSRIALIVDTMKEYSISNVKLTGAINIYETIINSFNMIYSRSKYITEIYLNDNLLTKDFKTTDKLLRNVINKTRIEQIWIIILNNALDELVKSNLSFQKRFIKIYINQQINGKAMITFKDNGGGIQDSIIKTLYQPFISGKTESGMGLGLHIAKKILNNHHGEIRAYNENNGAVFEVII